MTEPVNVLVVDDEPSIRRFLRTSLRAQGYRVLEATNGVEALEGVKDGQPDVIVLDLGLPDVDGIDLIGTIRGRSPVPIIVLSSRSDEKAKVRALDLGADDYVTKPFGMAELVARIKTAIRHRFQQQGETALYSNGVLSVDLVH